MKNRSLAVADWWLRRFDVDEALAGDLAEEHGRRQSMIWLARQVLIAVARQSLREVRTNRFMAVRAVVMGAILSWLYGYFVFVPLALFDEWLFLRGFADLRPWWPQGPPAFLLAAALGGALTGWILARIYRYSFVLFFVAVALIWQMAWLPFLLARMATAQNEWVRSTAILQIALGTFVMPLAMLLGGVLSSPASEGRASERSRHERSR